MWRFVVVSFAFLGFAFYEASGGSDYAPAPGSLQVAMRGKPIFAPPLDMSAPAAIAMESPPEPDMVQPKITKKDAPRKAVAERRAARAQKPAAYVGLSGVPKDELGGFGITLASAAEPLPGGNARETRTLDSLGSFDMETLVSDVRDVPIDRAIVSTRMSADIRSVAGDIANMRSGPGTDFASVDQLRRGADVEVLDRRGAWVELRDLETGQTGWMADWLITAAN